MPIPSLAGAVVVLALFAASGACGLVYETVWAKQASYLFGGTVLASTVVIATFMGGLALGSLAAGRRADRLDRPLRAYGLLEIGIAAAVLLPAWGAGPVSDLSRKVAGQGGLPVWACLALEALATASLLVLPTALMGATLPVICRAFSAQVGASRAVGLLYGANNLGAVVGAIAAGFHLIGRYGLSGSTRICQALNLAVGLIAILADRWLHEAAPATPPVSPGPGPRLLGPATALFLSGFSAMVFQIGLMRVMPLVLGSSIYSFVVIVASFILGLSLGSGLAGLASGRAARPALALSATMVATGLLFLATIPLFNHLPEVYLAIRGNVQVPFLAFQGFMFLVCLAYTLLPSMRLGAILPLAVEWVSLSGHAIGSAVGRLYAASTVGNIAGTALAGVALIPLLGFKATMEVGVALVVGAGLGLLWTAAELGRVGRFVATAAVALVLALYGILYPRLDVLVLACGVFQLREYSPPPSGTVLDHVRSGRRLLFAEEDQAAMVSVDELPAEGVRSLRVNGKVDASNHLDMANQRLLAHLPLLLHPSPRRALMIGFGSGISARSALQHEGLALDCVEISPAVVRASRHFLAQNGGVVADPRLTLHIDDGRRFVGRSRERWDVILAEPSNPWIAGVANLFTREYFALARERLAPGGIMAQWLQTYAMDESTFRVVVRTFRDVFPQASLLRVRKADVIMIGADWPVEPDFEAMDRRMKRSPVREDLESIGVTSPLVLLGHHLVARQDSGALCGRGPLHTDDRPILEYLAQVHLYASGSVVLAEDRYRTGSPHNWVRRYLETRPVDRRTLHDFFRHFRTDYDPLILLGLSRDLAACSPDDPAARSLLAEHLLGAGDLGAALGEIERVVARWPGVLAHERLRYRIALAAEGRDLSFLRRPSFPVTLRAAAECVRLAPEDPEDRLNLGTTLLRCSRWADGARALQEGVVLSERQGNPKRILTAYYLLLAADALVRAGDPAAGRRLLERARGMPRSLVGPYEELFGVLEDLLSWVPSPVTSR